MPSSAIKNSGLFINSDWLRLRICRVQCKTKFVCRMWCSCWLVVLCVGVGQSDVLILFIWPPTIGRVINSCGARSYLQYCLGRLPAQLYQTGSIVCGYNRVVFNFPLLALQEDDEDAEVDDGRKKKKGKKRKARSESKKEKKRKKKKKADSAEVSSVFLYLF